VADEGRLIGHNTDVSGVGAAIPECVTAMHRLHHRSGRRRAGAVARLDVTPSSGST
jgi:hypothetical protein